MELRFVYLRISSWYAVPCLGMKNCAGCTTPNFLHGTPNALSTSLLEDIRLHVPSLDTHLPVETNLVLESGVFTSNTAHACATSLDCGKKWVLPTVKLKRLQCRMGGERTDIFLYETARSLAATLRPPRIQEILTVVKVKILVCHLTEAAMRLRENAFGAPAVPQWSC